MWAASGADYYVYYPERTSKVATFAMTYVGLLLSSCFVFCIGIGLASGTTTVPSWEAANNDSPGALIDAGFRPLKGFGKFCSVIVALGPIANNIPGTYSSGLGFQILGRYAMKVPRFIWVTFGTIIYTVCACVGHDKLYDIFENFLALMGYWVCIWLVISLEEMYIFRRKTGFNWGDWNDPDKLPLGIAALAAFCVGWVGSAIGMAQVYFTGPVAAMVGVYGADMGIYLGVCFAGIVFPGLRMLELRFFHR